MTSLSGIHDMPTPNTPHLPHFSHRLLSSPTRSYGQPRGYVYQRWKKQEKMYVQIHTAKAEG